MGDSDSSEENLLSQALPVGTLGCDFDPAVPPTSAEEYLKRVVWEARQCKETVTVDIDQKRLKKRGPIINQPTKAPAPKGYLPSIESQKEFLAQFSDLRQQIDTYRETKTVPKPPVKLPGIKQREEWCRLCFGNSFQIALLQNAPKDAPKPDFVEGQPPLLSIVLNINQRGLENLIEWHTHWLEVLGFSEAQGRWLYSLLACLHKPLIPELCSQLRHIVRLCARIRASLDSAEHPHLAQLNVIICIVARYFSQDDLAD